MPPERGPLDGSRGDFRPAHRLHQSLDDADDALAEHACAFHAFVVGRLFRFFRWIFRLIGRRILELDAFERRRPERRIVELDAERRFERQQRFFDSQRRFERRR